MALTQDNRQAKTPRRRTTQGKPSVEGDAVAPNRFENARWTALVWAMTGSLLLWLALPPMALAPLAWAAPIPWLLLARRKQLPGRRPYVQLWAAGFGFWMAALHWLRLPHVATSLGWGALSFYLAFYLPVFVGLTRVAVHQLRVPLLLAAPVVWTGLELARGHLLTGFTMASLGHTQYRWIELIQIADLTGAYGVGFVVMFVAAGLARTIRTESHGWTARPLIPVALLLAAVLLYGHLRADHTTRPGPTIALIQGSIDTEMKADPEKRQRVHAQYVELSFDARRGRDGLDLIVWPETMFREPLIIYSSDARPSADDDWTLADLSEHARRSRDNIRLLAEALNTPLLLGIDTIDFGPDTAVHYNSALHVASDGQLLERYDKMHPVMFGEYIPLGDLFPWLYRLTPLSRGLTAGRQAVAIEVDGALLAPSICYETVVPHLIRRQINQLAAAGREPDVLVNLTNDGWFWGSSALDLHLICGVFRAVECRKPLVIAANTGFSAWIDGNGRILRQGPRRDTGTIVAEIGLDRRRSQYLHWGDWPAGGCLAACVGLAVIGYHLRKRVGVCGGTDRSESTPTS